MDTYHDSVIINMAFLCTTNFHICDFNKFAKISKAIII